MKIKLASLVVVLFTILSCNSNAQTKKLSLEPKKGKAVAVFASGCFWCSEHVFEAVVGVEEAVSGYSGGNVKNPSYELVGSNRTGHAEAVAVFYDPKVVSFKELVDVFFASQDPTTPNQQGPDKGSSYRSIAFYKNAVEKKIIEDKIKELTANKVFANPIVTEVKAVSDFYEAEAYHQDYVKNNPNQPYVKGVSIPRYNKFKKTYKGKLKPKS
ncbi:peptide-methionine (S)-S-oxide reductase MsrA [Flavobacterium degerlachei]|jgi:peptide-methionine (S)-S-oxide reductase|uniref:Peptide methionine sulfoxide reductase MsrA n=1 Tax=Flavobacterium degerlachei TaxID=229203 RepID=A0A1H2ZGW2_9FLAO|nr:peptide-methionine (S)-S-oxide reductase MsrA [Flavobacterium degerlachei]SDX16178.1 peptide-methionine (S)-S-oxide reductase [Flavobacterium degerlachei]